MSNNLIKAVIVSLFVFAGLLEVRAIVREVGPGKQYTTPALAANAAVAGDTILIYPNTYTGGHFISNKHGTSDNYIHFIGVDVNTVIFQGSSQAFHFSDVSYIKIENITIQGQTANGINIDDGGTFDSPTHHVYIKNCVFRNMNASGNNDLLKMSGVDDFAISNSVFLNGSGGGSGIDMVGCHRGVIEQSSFENMGSNCIQAKGGTQYITIKRNKFKNGGQRTLNLGGSTGFEFFRPQNATFEAADIDVYANVITGSTAAVAFVGCVRVKVVNNTIINPTNWIVRILQETVDVNRFLPCGQNSFINNIVYYGSISTHVNVGSNTAPSTFTFSNNLWYRHTNSSSSAPSLPVTEANPVIGQHPSFIDLSSENYKLQTASPARDAGTLTAFIEDFDGIPVVLGLAKDMGAYEYNTATVLFIEGNHQVCSSRLIQSYTVRSLFASGFQWTVSGGTLQTVQAGDTTGVIIWDPNATSHTISVLPSDQLNIPGTPYIQAISIVASDTLTYSGNNGIWKDRKNWNKYTLPQVCHHIIIPQTLIPLVLPLNELVEINSLKCEYGSQLLMLSSANLIIKQ